jgi:hypothetical protein
MKWNEMIENVWSHFLFLAAEKRLEGLQIQKGFFFEEETKQALCQNIIVSLDLCLISCIIEWIGNTPNSLFIQTFLFGLRKYFFLWKKIIDICFLLLGKLHNIFLKMPTQERNKTIYYLRVFIWVKFHNLLILKEIFYYKIIVRSK